MKRCLGLLLLFATAALSRHAPACGSPCADSLQVASDYAFGMHLFETKDYYRAITAFKRHAFFYPDSLRRQAEYMLPLCEYAAGRYGEAVGGFDSYSKAAAPGRLHEASQYYQGCCWLLLGQHQAAASIFAGAEFADPQLRERAALALGWAQLLAGEWAQAGAAMDRYSKLFPRGAGRSLAERISHELASEPLFGRKSEKLCLLYSAFPGGGQLYAGQRGDAVYSALLVGAAAMLAVKGAREDSQLALKVGSVLTATLYLGSVYGGVNGVRNHNVRQLERSIQSFRSELPASLFGEPILP